MLPTDGDLRMYYCHLADQISGLAGVYVDDGLQAGDPRDVEWAKQTEQRFDATARKYERAKFAGINFDKAGADGSATIGMKQWQYHALGKRAWSSGPRRRTVDQMPHSQLPKAPKHVAKTLKRFRTLRSSTKLRATLRHTPH